MTVQCVSLMVNAMKDNVQLMKYGLGLQEMEKVEVRKHADKVS